MDTNVDSHGCVGPPQINIDQCCNAFGYGTSLSDGQGAPSLLDRGCGGSLPDFLCSIYKELKEKMDVFSDDDLKSLNSESGPETTESILLSARNIIILLQDFQSRFFQDSSQEESRKYQQLSALSVDFKHKRDSGISSARDSSRWSFTSRSSENLLSDTETNEISNVSYSSSRQDTFKNPADIELNIAISDDVPQNVQFYIEDPDVLLTRNSAVSRTKGKADLEVSECSLALADDTVDVSGVSQDEEETHLPPLRENCNKGKCRRHPLLARQHSVDVSSTASLGELAERKARCTVFRRGMSACLLYCQDAEKRNNLSRMAVQHSESSEEDNNRQVCAQISSSSSGGSLSYMVYRRPETRTVCTQTDVSTGCTASLETSA